MVMRPIETVKITITTPTDNAFGVHITDIAHCLSAAMAAFRLNGEQDSVCREYPKVGLKITIEAEDISNATDDDALDI